MKKWLTLLGAIVFAFSSFAQTNYGNIRGVVSDEEGEPIPFANIVLKNKGESVLGTTSDFDGKFTLKPVPFNSYTIECSFAGYFIYKDSIQLVLAERLKEVKFMLSKDPDSNEKTVTDCVVNFTYGFNTTTETTFTREDIQNSVLRW